MNVTFLKATYLEDTIPSPLPLPHIPGKCFTKDNQQRTSQFS